jgi:hypothetical protein
MFAAEELIILSDSQIQNWPEQFRPHLEIQIPELPDFGDFEEMPRDHPVLVEHQADHLGLEDEDFQLAQNSQASTISMPEEYEHVIINICGFQYQINTTGMKDDELEIEIQKVENDAIDYLLDPSDERYMA